MFAILTIAFWITIGIFIGWNVNQPDWARRLQEKVLDFVAGVTGQAGK